MNKSDVIKISPLMWIREEKIKNEKGKPIELGRESNHYFLRDFYEDEARSIVVKKPSQVGISIAAILTEIHAGKFWGINQIHTLPTASDVQAFVPDKVNEIIRSNPCIRKGMDKKQVDAIQQKQFGKAFLYFKGTVSKREAQMLSSDRNCYEEGTEILTDKGFKNVENITLEDNLYTLNSSTGKVEIHKPHELTEGEVDETIRFTSGNYDLGVTKNHRMFIAPYYGGEYRIQKAEDLLDRPAFKMGIEAGEFDFTEKGNIIVKESIRKRPQGSSLLKAKEFRYRSEYERKAFYKFLGWYLSEGSVVKVNGKIKGSIAISQKKNNGYIKDIEKTLDEMKVNWRYDGGCFYFVDWALAIYLERLGHSYDKYIPYEFLHDKDNLIYLLERLYWGDAFKHEGEKYGYLNTASKKLADTTQIAWLMIGVNSRVTKTKEKTGRIMYRVGPKRYKAYAFNRYKTENKSGKVFVEKGRKKVYCPTVKNNIVLVRDKKGSMLWCGQTYDEVDRSEMQEIVNYSSRMEGASSLRLERWISTPTMPEFGIDSVWGMSDQKHWRFNCPKCKHEQHMEWPGNIDIEKGRYMCSKCGATITHEDIRKGEWKARFPNREMSGYWMTQMICPWISPENMIKTYHECEEGLNEMTIEYFYNHKLGMPYVSTESQIPASLIYKNLVKQEHTENNSVIGVDVQLRELYAVVGNENGVYALLVLKDDELYKQTEGEEGKSKWGRLSEMMDIYDARYVVIDGGFMPNDVVRFARDHEGKAYVNWYKEDPKKVQIVRFGEDVPFTEKRKEVDEDIKVLTDRNRMIDQILNELKKGDIRFHFEKNDQRIQEFVSHAGRVYARVAPDKVGIEKREWVSTGKDDFLHALVYWRIGMIKKNRMEKGIDKITK
jgi:DNA-directed RNA polymerase subunit M/transcription elongation factor TFIIS